jgi:Uma2 family endonuclease
MGKTITKPAKSGEPVWELARLFPYQGAWSEEEYLSLETNHLIEFSSGSLEMLPMPTIQHQLIVAFLYNACLSFIKPKQLGTILFAPLRVKLWEGKFREPDIVFLSKEKQERLEGRYLDWADLVIEVVSGAAEDRRRDLITKRREYAQAGINEYWIVDPAEEIVTVLTLIEEEYQIHGEFKPGVEATSPLLIGFSITVAEIFSAAQHSVK